MKMMSTWIALGAMLAAGAALAQTSDSPSNQHTKPMTSDPPPGSSAQTGGASNNAGGSASTGAGSGASGSGMTSNELTTGGSPSGQQRPAADAENKRQPGAKNQ